MTRSPRIRFHFIEVPAGMTDLTPQESAEMRPGDRLPESKWVLAGRVERLQAAIVDTLLLCVLVVAILYFTGSFSEPELTETRFDLVSMLLWWAVGFGVFLALQGYPLYTRGQTWGKRALGIRIVDAEGGRLPFWRLIVLRYVVWHWLSLIPYAGNAISLVNVLMIFREDHRCGHDLLAGTRVVEVTKPSAIAKQSHS